MVAGKSLQCFIESLEESLVESLEESPEESLEESPEESPKESPEENTPIRIEIEPVGSVGYGSSN